MNKGLKSLSEKELQSLLISYIESDEPKLDEFRLITKYISNINFGNDCDDNDDESKNPLFVASKIWKL